MLDIIGNIKIDESKPERVDYFIACLKSWAFFKEHCKIYIYLDSGSEQLKSRMADVFHENNIDGWIVTCSSGNSYGKTYIELLGFCKNPFVLNFIEDHFALIDDKEKMLGLLHEMETSNVDVLKTSFFRIEQNSQDTLKHAAVSHYGKIFRMNAENHTEYGRHYGSRYFLGVNFLTTRAFALKFWNRDRGHRPHEYEIDVYRPEWEHTCMIPSMEIQCAVDDDHGEENTCLLKRNEEKWNRIINPSPVLGEGQGVRSEVEQPDVYPPLEGAKGEGKIFPEPSNEVPLLLEETEKRLHQPSAINHQPFVFNNLKAENEIYEAQIALRFNDVVASNIYLIGKQSAELEERFAKFIGKKYCIAVKNCTDALMMTVKYLLRERPDATVIVPNFGAYPTAIAVKNCTDNIHFIDVDESLTMDVIKLPRIKNGIIIPVHLFGNHANMKVIKRYADANGHIIIEDCAQSCGSGSGQIGEFSCFSFYPTKPLGTMGDGGAICTNDKTAYEELLKMRNYGLPIPLSPLGERPGEGANGITHPGLNSRMGELECAVVNAKLGSFEQFFEKRRAIASRYKKNNFRHTHKLQLYLSSVPRSLQRTRKNYCRTSKARDPFHDPLSAAHF